MLRDSETSSPPRPDDGDAPDGVTLATDYP
jgi:hypothetical protein